MSKIEYKPNLQWKPRPWSPPEGYADMAQHHELQEDLKIIRGLLSTPALRDWVVWLAGAGFEAYLRRREAMQLAELWPKGWPQRVELEAVR